MSLHDQPAFIEFLRSLRCADDALLSVAVQPLYELLELTAQLIFGSAARSDAKTRPSVPPNMR